MTLLDAGAGLTEVLVTTGDRRFRTVQAGSGSPTVVFESGLSASASEWVAVQRSVAERVATLSYDRAGYAGSDVTSDGRLLTDLAADLERVLAAAGVTGPLVLVGHSWGGPVLRAFAQATQRELAGIVLVDGTVSGVMTESEALKAKKVFGLMGKLSSIGLNKPLMMLTLKRTTTGLSDADRDLTLRDLLGRRDSKAAAREAVGLAADVRNLPALEQRGFPAGVPVTFLMGALADRGQTAMREQFLAVTQAEAEALGARFVVGPGSSHFVPQQEPDLVADEILRLACPL